MKLFENNVFNTSTGHILLEEVKDIVFYPVKMLGLFYTLSCVFFLLYIIRDTNQRLKKRKLISRTANEEHTVYLLNEQLVRNVIILIFLFFETTFSISGILYGIYIFSLSIITHYGQFEEKSDYTLFIITTLSNLISFSFSMMLWLFGVSILHLSYAAKNQLKVRNLIKFILIGFFANLVVLLGNYIFRCKVLIKFIQITLYHITIIVVIYITKEKFFPAMNSRIIDAYHLYLPITDRYLKRSLKRYKKLIPFILVTFELYVLKDVLLFLKYGISSLIHLYPHLFNLNDVPNELSPQEYTLYSVERYLLVLMPILDLIVLFNLTLLNFAYISSIILKVFKSLVSTKLFRFQIYSSQSDDASSQLRQALLPDANKLQ